MDKKKLLVSALTVAGFLATSYAAKTGSLAFAGDKPAQGSEAKKEEGKKMKQGSCSGGSCGAAKDKKKEEAKEGKEGSCGGMKDKGKTDKKESGKQGSCTAKK